MPSYKYRCSGCDDVFEIVQKITEVPLSVCEKCGESIQRLIQSVGIIFNGPGFYVNDYRNSKKEIVNAD